MQVAMAIEFRDVWLESFYEEDRSHKKYPARLRQLFIESCRYLMLQRRSWILESRQVTVLNAFKVVCLGGALSG